MINSATFFTSDHCKSRMHCRKCRDPHNASFRAVVADVYGLTIDFECPHNMPWLDVPPQPRRISATLRDMDIDALVQAASQVTSTDDQQEYKAIMRDVESATCTDCARRRAAARLRVLLMRAQDRKG